MAIRPYIRYFPIMNVEHQEARLPACRQTGETSPTIHLSRNGWCHLFAESLYKGYCIIIYIEIKHIFYHNHVIFMMKISEGNI